MAGGEGAEPAGREAAAGAEAGETALSRRHIALWPYRARRPFQGGPVRCWDFEKSFCPFVSRSAGSWPSCPRLDADGASCCRWGLLPFFRRLLDGHQLPLACWPCRLRLPQPAQPTQRKGTPLTVAVSSLIPGLDDWDPEAYLWFLPVATVGPDRCLGRHGRASFHPGRFRDWWTARAGGGSTLRAIWSMVNDPASEDSGVEAAPRL